MRPKTGKAKPASSSSSSSKPTGAESMHGGKLMPLNSFNRRIFRATTKTDSFNAFVIGQKFITAWHAVEKCAAGEITVLTDADGKVIDHKHPWTRVGKLDIATSPAIGYSLPSFKGGNVPQINDVVTIMAYDWTTSQWCSHPGKVSRVGAGVLSYQIATQQGWSGAPVIDSTGAVVAVHTDGDDSHVGNSGQVLTEMFIARMLGTKN